MCCTRGCHDRPHLVKNPIDIRGIITKPKTAVGINQSIFSMDFNNEQVLFVQSNLIYDSFNLSVVFVFYSKKLIYGSFEWNSKETRLKYTLFLSGMESDRYMWCRSLIAISLNTFYLI